MATTINTKVSENRGRKRVYFEGRKLASEGYTAGMKFDLEVRGDSVSLKVNENGRYTVSKRIRGGIVMPIIDLTAKEIAEVFYGVDMVSIAISKGGITISPMMNNIAVLVTDIHESNESAAVSTLIQKVAVAQ